jgi:PAS domain S-box-containing protein
MKTKQHRIFRLNAADFKPALIIWILTGLYIVFVSTFMRSDQIIITSLRLIICVPGIAAVFILMRLSQILNPGISRLQWQVIGTGLTFWIAADYYCLFFSTNVISNQIIAAWVNWINFAGFLLIAGGWLFSQVLFRQRIIRLKLILDMTISCGAMTLLGWLVFVFPNTNAEIRNLIANRWQLTYPVLDIGLLALLLNMLLLVKSNLLQKTILWFMLGVVSFTISDLAPASITMAEQLLPGTSMELGIIVGYSAILTGVYYAYRNPKLLVEGPESGFEWTNGRRIQGVLPLAMILVLVVELVIVWQNSLNFPQATIGITAMLWLLLIARQGVAAGEFELRQYAILFQNTAEPSFITDKKLKIVLVNPAMLQICGLKNEAELLGRTIKEVFSDPGIPDQVESNWKSEVRLNLSDSIYLPVELSLNKISFDTPGNQRIAGTAHDLTPQKEQQAALLMANQRLSDLQGELEKLNEGLEQRVIEKTTSLQTAFVQLEEQHKKLQSLDQMKSDFVSMVSHELRAPLTNISGGIELLLANRKQLNEKTHRSLTLVQTEIQRLTRFVETILDLSAMEAERLPLYPEPVNVNDLIRNTIDQFKDLPGSQRLIFQPKNTLPAVLADPSGLVSVITHLIDNAIKYAPEGKIHLSTDQKRDKVHVTIRDHGPGIPIDAQPYLFEKFYRVNPVDSQTIYGHGLGLYMANRMLEAMGGEIGVKNCEDGGAEFTISLPTIEENDEPTLIS